MGRIKLEMPKRFQFETQINVRITDLNYGNHLANQNFLSYAHEARVQFFQSNGFTELDFAGVSLIQKDAAVVFEAQVYFGDQITVAIASEQNGNSSFNLYYQFTNQKNTVVARLRTLLVCFDYQENKAVGIPQKVLESGVFK